MEILVNREPINYLQGVYASKYSLRGFLQKTKVTPIPSQLSTKLSYIRQTLNILTFQGSILFVKILVRPQSFSFDLDISLEQSCHIVTSKSQLSLKILVRPQKLLLIQTLVWLPYYYQKPTKLTNSCQTTKTRQYGNHTNV